MPAHDEHRRQAHTAAQLRLDLLIDDLHRAATLTDPAERADAARRTADFIDRLGWRDCTALATAALFRLAETTYQPTREDT